MSAIVTEGLTKRFGDETAVADLDLAVEEGEIFGFLGPNGAGKSTTISMLLGFLEPTEGSAAVLGTDVTADARGVRQRTGLLPEGLEPVPNLTGREHVATAVETKGADDDPDALLERVGLDPDDARRPVDDYSTGMFQRLTLAVALAGEPDLLVLDEPSSGLDPNGVQRVREVVREERDRGATVFFSSHILDEVERVSDRVGILQDGELTAVNSVDNLRAELGMGAVVKATVDDGEVDPADVAGVDGVTDVTVDGATVQVACATPRAKMPALQRVDRAATVADVTVEEASLEDLFEAYTGGEGRTPAGSGGSAGEEAGVPADRDGSPEAAAAGGDRA